MISIVDSGSISNFCTRLPSQHKTFYAQGKYWIFYPFQYAYPYIIFKTSNTLTQWPSQRTYIGNSQRIDDGALLSLIYDGTYFHYIRGLYQWGTYYRKGQPNSDGTIDWIAERQLNTMYWQDFTLIQDSLGYPWFAFYFDNHGYITKSSSNNTFIEEEGFPIQFTSRGAQCIALENGKVYVVHGPYSAVPHGYLKGVLWNGTSWESEENVSNIEVGGAYFCTFVLSALRDNVHVAYLSANNEIIHVEHVNGIWNPTNIIASGVPSSSTPVLMADPVRNVLHIFWAIGTQIYTRVWDGSWNPTTLLLEETETLTRNDDLACADQIYNDKIMLYYQTGQSSLKTIKIASFDLGDLYRLRVESTPINVPVSLNAAPWSTTPAEIDVNTGAYTLEVPEEVSG